MKPEGLFNEEYFTNQSIAKSKEGIIDQIVTHLLKIKYGFDEDRDRDKHISDAAGWIWEVRNDIISDKSNATAVQVGTSYKRINIAKKAIKITQLFKKNYKFSGSVSSYDIEDMVDIMTNCIINCTRRSDINEMISHSLRSEKLKSYSEIMRERNLRRAFDKE